MARAWSACFVGQYIAIAVLFNAVQTVMGTVPQISSVIATPASRTEDSSLGAGDAVEITFNVNTSLGLVNATYPDAASLSWVQPFNISDNVTQSFGTSFSGTWVAGNRLRIAFLDTTGCTVRPRLTAIRILAEGNLKNATNNSAASTSTSTMMLGSFVSFRVTEIEAMDNVNNTGVEVGDSVLIRFSLPTIYSAGTTMNEVQLDSLFGFAGAFGTGINGTWIFDDQLSVVMVDPPGTALPGSYIISSAALVPDLAGLSDGNLAAASVGDVRLKGGWKNGKSLCKLPAKLVEVLGSCICTHACLYYCTSRYVYCNVPVLLSSDLWWSVDDAGPTLVYMLLSNPDALDTCGPTDTLVFNYDVPTNQPVLSSQNAMDLFDLRTKFPYFTSYSTNWDTSTTLVLTIATVNTSLPYPDFVNALFTQSAGTNFAPRSLDGLSKEATGAQPIGEGECGMTSHHVLKGPLLRFELVCCLCVTSDAGTPLEFTALPMGRTSFGDGNVLSIRFNKIMDQTSIPLTSKQDVDSLLTCTHPLGKL